MLAKRLRWDSPQTLYKIAMAGLLHDIGKKEIPEEILLKPRANYTPAEVQMYESHPIRGARILQNLTEIPPDVVQIALQHHERDQGTGYPHGLKKGKIQPLARLVGLVDDFVHLLLPGPDSPGISPEDAIQRLSVIYGKTLDSELIDTLREIFHLPTEKRTPTNPTSKPK